MFIEHGAGVQKKGERASPGGNHLSEPQPDRERDRKVSALAEMGNKER